MAAETARNGLIAGLKVCLGFSGFARSSDFPLCAVQTEVASGVAEFRSESALCEELRHLMDRTASPGPSCSTGAML